MCIQRISVDDLFMAELCACKCITVRQKTAIKVEAEKTPDAGAELLINILRRRSVADFKNFLTCLQKTNQHHVSQLLTAEGGIIGRSNIPKNVVQ